MASQTAPCSSLRFLCKLSGQHDVPQSGGPGDIVFDAPDEQAQFFIGVHGAFPTFFA
jgi:hypothetical protein